MKPVFRQILEELPDEGGHRDDHQSDDEECEPDIILVYQFEEGITDGGKTRYRDDGGDNIGPPLLLTGFAFFLSHL